MDTPDIHGGLHTRLMPRAQRVEHLKRSLEDYFAAVGAPAGHVFTLRDLNHQVMMNVFAPEERALLDVALAALIEQRDLLRVSPTEYLLTEEGALRIRGLRSRSGRHNASQDGVATPNAQDYTA